MAGFKTMIDEQFGAIRKQTAGDGLVVDRSSEIFTGRVGRGAGDRLAGKQRAAAESPQANWGQHQIDANMAGASSDPFTPGDLGTVLKGLTVSVENMAITSVDLGIVMGASIREILTARWDIPVLTPLYEQMICQGDGSR
jgi:hypothetical protein